MAKKLCWIAALSLVSFVAGCGSGRYQTGDIEATAPVSGTLTYQGKPLEYYQVVFMPFDGRRVATGTTDAQGKFKLGTNDGGDGSPVGQMKVAVSFVGPPSNAEAGTEAIIDDPSKLPKPKVKIPAKFADPDASDVTQVVPPEGLTDLKLDLK